uniref:Uncharacterized protein n=1 Tax=Physcomitrium patens TaxID=3218 RepID=A0A2K1KVW0_PHYPA|nr:hypothetical protein PHYPA_004905 [Physcomitrium patens]
MCHSSLPFVFRTFEVVLILARSINMSMHSMSCLGFLVIRAVFLKLVLVLVV